MAWGMVVAAGCGDEEASPVLPPLPPGAGGSTSSTSASATTDGSGGATTTTGGGMGGAGAAGGMGTGGDGGAPVDECTGSGGFGAGTPTGGACDYEVESGVLVIEAEDLPLSGSWQVVSSSDFSGFTGTGYIEWTGNSQNNNPGQGLISVAIDIPQAGRYRWQWRNQIGMGNNTTEHNDTWLRFPDAAAYYGKREQNGAETRRYPKPICEDAYLMCTVESTGVDEASCPDGSTSDGWLKVYSSGADSWKWSTRTSDNDAHDIFVEFDTAGVYTVEMSARGDHHLIDRIVLHREDVASNTATDLSLTPTSCN